MLALFQSVGILPVEIDFWNSSWITGAISSLSYFRITGLIPPGPGALSGLRFESNLRIPSTFLVGRTQAVVLEGECWRHSKILRGNYRQGPQLE